MKLGGIVDLSKIYISNHAFTRFIERWKEFEKTPLSKDWLETIKTFLSNVTEIKKIPSASFETFKRYGRISRYFLKIKNWIFVTDEDLTVLITIEWRKKNPQSWIIPKTIKRKVIRKRKKN